MTEVLRKGVRELLAQAVEQEVHEWLTARADLTDERGRKLVVRNGHLSERTIPTGIGPVEVRPLRGIFKRRFRRWSAPTEDDKVCLLVLIGVTKAGRKELVAVWDGTRASELSWLEVLRDLKRRGLTMAPKLAIGGVMFGFWAALWKEWPSTRESAAADCRIHDLIHNI